ncbi:MAG: type II toxin-antitoxin system Phd/YefM family antitoxin [Bacteroidota bacterium]
MALDLTNDFLGVTEFRSAIHKNLEKVEKTKRPLVLTKGGKPSAVVLDVHSYQALCDVVEQSQRQAFVDSVRRGEADVQAGRVQTHEEAMEAFESRRKARKK